MKYCFTFLLVLHAIGHVLFIGNAWGAWRTEPEGSWLLAGVLHLDRNVIELTGLLWLLPLAGFLYGTWGYFNDTSYWQLTLAAAALLSVLLIVVWWQGINMSSAFFALAFDIVVLVATALAIAASPATSSS